MMDTNTASPKRSFRPLYFGVAFVVLIILLSSNQKLGGPFVSLQLKIESVPPGATVFVNGQLAGATPVVLSGLNRGAYGIRLEKEGYLPLSKPVDLSQSVSLHETLESRPFGSLQVHVKPDDAEVLLDGELAGYTPLDLSHVAVGSYELQIRKTNYATYSAWIDVTPDAPLAFSGFELRDNVYGMLSANLKSEPQRLSHYLDLGHYLFVNNRFDEAVSVYTQGLEAMQKPLDFDGAGYPGKKEMTPDEISFEQLRRSEDEARFRKEMEKHRAWQSKDAQAFRAKMDEAQDLLTRRNINSWQWVDSMATLCLKSHNYAKAAQLYSDHLETTKDASPDVAKAYNAIIEVYLMQRDVTRATERFEKFYTLFHKDGPALQQCGKMMYVYHERIRRDSERASVLALAEKALRGAVDLLTEPVAKSQCQLDLGNVLVFEDHSADAVPIFKQLVASAPNIQDIEDRSLRLADALRRSGRLEESKAVYEKLKASERSNVRESAVTGLNFIAADEIRKVRKPGN